MILQEPTRIGKVGILSNWSKPYIFGREEIQSNSRMKPDPGIVSTVGHLPLANCITHAIKSNKSNKYHARDQVQLCVYCKDKNHKSSECSKVTTVSERRQILAKHRLCFNCTGENHRAAECPSKRSSQQCDRRHHTSICDRTGEPAGSSGGGGGGGGR